MYVRTQSLLAYCKLQCAIVEVFFMSNCNLIVFTTLNCNAYVNCLLSMSE